MRPWRHRAVRVGTGAVVVVALVGGGVAAYAAKGNGPDEYRTAAVAYGDVEQTVALSGTITPSGRSDLSFSTAGTVAKVKAKVGQKVTAGEVLARLDTTSLTAAVTKARAQVAAAKAQLAQDEDAQTSSTSTSSSSSTKAPSSTKVPQSSASSGGSSGAGSGGNSSNSSGSTSSSGSSSSALVAQIKALQNEIVTAQQDVDTAQTSLSDAKTGALSYLASVGDALDDLTKALDPDATDAGALGELLTEAKSDCDTTGGTTADPTACTDDIGEAIDALTSAHSEVPHSDFASAEEAVSTAAGELTDAKTKLGDYVTKLDAVLSSAQTQAGGSTGSTAPTTTGSSTTGSSTTGSSTKAPASKGSATTSAGSGSGTASAGTSSTGFSGGSGSGGGETVTAATLAKDQASIDSAKSDLVSDTQALAGATIAAPATGTVAQVSVDAGDSATAGGDAIVLISPGTTTIELTVSSTQVAQLKVGQKAEISPAGASKTYTGSVTRIGQLPTASTTGSSTYPVTITLDQQDLDLLTGATASVDVVLGTAQHALTVPTSAVSGGFVEVYGAGKISRVRVTTGLVGRARTVVTNGLKAGQRVVLADVSSPLPTGDTTNQRGGVGRASFGGGALPAVVAGDGFGRG